MKKVSVIFWSKTHDIDIEEYLPSELSSDLYVKTIKDYNNVVSTLEKNENFTALITILCPSNIEGLYEIQQIQKKFSKLSVMAIFDTGSDMVLSTGTQMIVDLFNTNNKFLEENKKLPPKTVNQSESTDITPDMPNLTPRQMEVLELLVNGNSNKQIARKLFVCEGTVKIHCMAIFKEFGVTNRTQAALHAKSLFN